MRISRHKAKLIAAFILISLVFVYLRLKTLGHLLMWDEARNIISLRAFLSNNSMDPIYGNYFFHPPLYMVFANLLFPFRAGFDIRLELLSLSISYLTLLVVYLLSARIAGWRYAFLSGLFLSIMPVSIAYDTWIKRDGLASLLGYLAIFLLLKRKFLWCAIALSFSLLAKESALFFVLAVTCLLFVLKEKETLKKIFVIYGVLFILTVWWYACFSTMPRLIFDIYFSAQKNALTWANSPFYYFKKLLPDLGPPLLFFFITGVCSVLYLIFRKKQYNGLLPLVVALCVYIPSSFIIACKTPWLCLSARPALAMIAGAGALFLLKRAKKSKLVLTVLAFLLIFSVFTGFSFSYDKYHMKTYSNGWSCANFSRDLALYLNKYMRDDERLMATQFSYWGKPACLMCRVFLYYFNGKPVYIIDGKDSAEEVMKAVIDKRISWLVVIDSPNEQFNFHALVRDITDSIPVKPTVVGWSYIWKTDALWRYQDGKKDLP